MDIPTCRSGCGEPAEFAAKHVRSTLRRDPLLQWESKDMGYDTPCHVWTGNKTTGRKVANPARYGRIYLHGSYKTAHRATYEAKYGPVPDGMHLHHLCFVTLCVNPDHLQVVTPADHARLRPDVKLTNEDIPAIRMSRLPGTKLAEMFGVSESLISAVKNGHSWVD